MPESSVQACPELVEGDGKLATSAVSPGNFMQQNPPANQDKLWTSSNATRHSMAKAGRYRFMQLQETYATLEPPI
jgi:hypothetical protein